MADSYNELFGLGGHSEDASIEAWWPLQDDAASTAIDDVTSNGVDATLTPDDTADLSVAGPNSWLTKAFDCGASVGNAYATFATITIPDGPLTVMWRHKPPGGTASQWVLGNSADNFQLAIVNLGANALGLRSDAAGADYRWTDSDINDSSSWRSWCMTSDGTGANAYKNAVDMGTAGTATGTDFGSSIDRLFRRNAGTYFGGEICDISVWTRELSSAEVSQWNSGPELRYSSGVDFQSDGTFDIGTWALPGLFSSGSNGSQTQEVLAANAAGSVLDTATTATGTLDLSSEAGNTCYLLARVSNSGGYDIGDFATRTSGYGSADDGYYELASVTAAGGGGVTVPVMAHHYRTLARA